MRVRVGSHFLQQEDVWSGVPQGSVLGPLLFLIFVNELPDWVVNDMLMFADDTKIWTSIRSQQDSESLQENLCSLAAWSERWLLRFNPEKCKVMHIRHSVKTVYTLTPQGQIHTLQGIDKETSACLQQTT